MVHRGFLLVHAEFPTPFKCSYNPGEIVSLQDDSSKSVRAHIDMVMLNPNYIDWVLDSGFDVKFISGIEQSSTFGVFNPELNVKYEEFFRLYNEPVLNFAIEFKYLRHGYLGTKYPVMDIVQDVEKLRLLRDYPTKKFGKHFKFVESTLAAVFIADRGNYIVDELTRALAKYDPSEYVLVTSQRSMKGDL